MFIAAYHWTNAKECCFSIRWAVEGAVANDMVGCLLGFLTLIGRVVGEAAFLHGRHETPDAVPQSDGRGPVLLWEIIAFDPFFILSHI